MTQGYEADGWLGLLLGTSMWYGFYGETLQSESAFSNKMDALSREIGSRGKADSPPDASVESDELESALHTQLRATKMRDLLQQARDAGISDGEIVDSQDADDPKAALVELLVKAGRAEEESVPGDTRAELLTLRMRDLMAKAEEWGVQREALYDAQDSEQPKVALVELLLSSRPRVEQTGL
eukprot:COSAG06_NODE_13330_length_1267_cov_2.488014_2_plen_182_part_01